MSRAKDLAQELFDKAVAPIMDLPLTDEAIKRIGLELTLVMLDEIFKRNTDQSKHNLYVDAHYILQDGDVEF